mmetsp:Transcript_1307/g.3224  ORF Transcript_1307/g.3224 Transcript_1307/m.3224 type:complete len:212 (+) Transcript_1307:1-636(+)
MRSCMYKKFEAQLASLKPDPALNSSELVASRLRVASTPAVGKSRYTFVPAAVSASDGWLQLGRVDAGQMIRGGAHSFGVYANAGVTMSVRMADVVTWMISSFREEDFIFLKLDAEGAEFGILNGLMEQGKFGLIDMLLMECHNVAGDCQTLMSKVKDTAKTTNTQVLTESGQNPGFDFCSQPRYYRPQDPSSGKDRSKIPAGCGPPESKGC